MPKRINTENATIELMRNSEILLDGYPMALVQSLQDDLQQTDQTIDVYGAGSQITYKIVDGATLNVTVVADPQSNVLYDVATGQNPATADQEMRGYYPNERVRMDLLRNFRNAAGDGYDAVVFYPNWDGMICMPQGGPKEHGQIRLDGRCKTPIEIRAARETKIAGIGSVVPLLASADGSYAVGQLTLEPTMLPAMPPLRGYESGALSIELQAADARAKGSPVNATRRIPVLAGSVTPFPDQEWRLLTADITEIDLAVPVLVQVDSTDGMPDEGGCYIEPAESGGGQECQYEKVDATTLRVYRTGDTLGSVQDDHTFQAGDRLRYMTPKVHFTGEPAPEGTLMMMNTIGLPAVGRGTVMTSNFKFESISWTGKTANSMTGVTRGATPLSDADLALGFVGPRWNHVVVTADEAAQVGMALTGAILPGQKTVATRAYVQYVHTPASGWEGDGYQDGRCLIGDGITDHDARYD